MANKHLYLNNQRNKNPRFNRQRFVPEEKKGETTKVIEKFKIENLRNNFIDFTNDYQRRYDKRTIEFPEYIDLVEISFFPIFGEDLKKKFYLKYGLIPVFYTDFNRTVTFEVDDQDLFEIFKNDIQYIISHDEDVPYSGEDYNLIANIFKFRFIDKRRETEEKSNLIISTFQSVSTEIARVQKKRLLEYFREENISFTSNSNSDLFYINEASNENVKEIENNFDIVQTITSSRALNVRPGMFGSLRMEYGFDVEIPEGLPIVGIIDTGINQIDPFNNLIENDGINITGETDTDISGHGTLVAGLAIFGTDLPTAVSNSYKAKCKVLPIKVLHRNNDGINFPNLLEAIKLANQNKGVRIFNMSLVFYPKKYNEAFSKFAYELDKLTYELDILVFISVGNFDSNSLNELLTNDYHTDHEYPDFFYKLDSTSPIHNCENTNISTPSESLNNLSIGSLAGNLENEDNSDLTPNNIYPAYYSRKFHFDFEQEINKTKFKRNQKNKNLNKPDLVFDGGDLLKDDSGIEVLSIPGASSDNYFTRTSGTSLAAPLIASIAAEIMTFYPQLSAQSIKALLINSAGYYKPSKLDHFKDKPELLKKLIGFGKPDKNKALESDNHSITMVIEDQINPLEIISIPIFLPEYLIASRNKLIFDISLSFSFPPDKGNHLGYQPIHMSFNLMKNLPIKEIATGKAEDTVAKKGFSWSEDHFGKENILFSNTQKKQYKLQPNDLSSLNGQVAIAVRCLLKDNIDETLKQYLKSKSHSFSLVIHIHEEIKNETDNNLYDEISFINELEVIGEIQTDTEIDLDTES